MFRKPMLASSLVFAIALTAATSQAEAAFANLVRQYQATAPSGEAVVVCVYSLDGKDIERQYPSGNFCPARIEI